MPVALAVCSAVALAVAPVLVLAVEARLRFTRRLSSFRCRVGRVGPVSRRRPGPRWRLLGTRAAWARDVLLVRSGPLHVGITPIAVAVPRTATVRRLGAGEVRGLGDRPVSLRFTTDEGSALEIAVAGVRLAELVGPFVTVLLPDPPPAPRDMDA